MDFNYGSPPNPQMLEADVFSSFGDIQGQSLGRSQHFSKLLL